MGRNRVSLHNIKLSPCCTVMYGGHVSVHLLVLTMVLARRILSLNCLTLNFRFAAEIFPKHGIQVSEAPQRGTQSVAITSIILQCPLKEVRNRKRPAKSDSDNAFDLYIANVAFQRAGTFEDNCVRLSTSTIKLMWGREMEVKVAPPVQLENGNNYMIFLDQVEPVLYLDLKNPSRTEVVFERRLAQVVTFSYFSYFGLRATVPEGRETVSVSRPRGTQVIH